MKPVLGTFELGRGLVGPQHLVAPAAFGGQQAVVGSLQQVLHRFALLMAPSGFVAVIAGWVTTEVGRQPYVIYNLLRTEEAVSPIATPAVTGSLIAFVIVYFAVFSAGILYILKLMAQPPNAALPEPAAPIRTAGITPSPAIPRPDAAGTDGERG